MTSESVSNARALYNTRDYGVLSTISARLEGFPFGSVVPYCLDGKGMPLILISTIAQHTKNILKDERCSLTILKDSHDVQSNGRLCIIGNAELLPEDQVLAQERYYRHFPNSKGYHSTHNFSFYRIKPVSVRYIGGFGAIHWFEPEDFLISNPFQGKGEDRVVDHMNEDHMKDLKRYCEYYKQMTIGADDQVRMVGIDALGFDVFVNDQKVRFSFDEPISNAGEARTAMVALSKGAR